MTVAIVVGLLLAALGLVSSQLFRLRDWLNKAPPVDPHHSELSGDSDD